VPRQAVCREGSGVQSGRVQLAQARLRRRAGAYVAERDGMRSRPFHVSAVIDSMPRRSILPVTLTHAHQLGLLLEHVKVGLAVAAVCAKK
jgi:hypothetical protein